MTDFPGENIQLPPGQIIKIEREPWGFLIRPSHIYFALIGAIIATVFCLLLLSTPAALTECSSDKVKITEFSGINTSFTCVPVDIFYLHKNPKLKEKFKAKRHVKPPVNKRLNRGIK